MLTCRRAVVARPVVGVSRVAQVVARPMARSVMPTSSIFFSGLSLGQQAEGKFSTRSIFIHNMPAASTMWLWELSCGDNKATCIFKYAVSTLESVDGGMKVTMMRHGNKVKHLGRPADQRKALIRTLVTQLIQHGAIRTTKVSDIHNIVKKSGCSVCSVPEPYMGHISPEMQPHLGRHVWPTHQDGIVIVNTGYQTDLSWQCYFDTGTLQLKRKRKNTLQGACAALVSCLLQCVICH